MGEAKLHTLQSHVRYSIGTQSTNVSDESVASPIVFVSAFSRRSIHRSIRRLIDRSIDRPIHSRRVAKKRRTSVAPPPAPPPAARVKGRAPQASTVHVHQSKLKPCFPHPKLADPDNSRVVRSLESLRVCGWPILTTTPLRLRLPSAWQQIHTHIHTCTPGRSGHSSGGEQIKAKACKVSRPVSTAVDRYLCVYMVKEGGSRRGKRLNERLKRTFPSCRRVYWIFRDYVK